MTQTLYAHMNKRKKQNKNKNKIRDKGKIVSAWKRGGGGKREGVGGKKGGGGKGEVMTQSLYAHMNKGKIKKRKKPESTCAPSWIRERAVKIENSPGKGKDQGEGKRKGVSISAGLGLWTRTSW
jgi:hypothetical protein